MASPVEPTDSRLPSPQPSPKGRGGRSDSSDRLTVPADAARVRLDLFLADALGVSRSDARRLLAGGGVRVDGRVAQERDKGLILSPGATVVADAEGAASEALRVTPEPDAPLAVLAAGDGWLAIDKPAGVPVHPLRPGEVGTVLNAAVARHPDLQGVGERGLRSGVVHRLDVDTSGVLVLATLQSRWDELRRAFAEHRTEKVYRAVVRGELAGEGREALDLYVAQHRPARVRVVPPGMPRTHRPPGTRRCDLAWRAVAPLRGATLIEVRLGTGFLHQIRATMAHLGHPVLGDRAYADRAGSGPPRLMLHATRLRVAEMDVHSPDPPDFAEVIAGLR